MSAEQIAAAATLVAALSPIITALFSHGARLSRGNKAFSDFKAQHAALEGRVRALEIDIALRKPPPKEGANV